MPWSRKSAASPHKPGSTMTSVRSGEGRGAGTDSVPIGTAESPMARQPARPPTATQRETSPRVTARGARIRPRLRFARLGDEAQRHAVVAVAQTGGLRPVVEQVAVVSAAARAVVFGAFHEEFAVH